MALRIVEVDDQTLEQWRVVHNQIIPTAPLSIEDVQDRATRYHLTLAYDDESLVGNATVRPPDPQGMATVIVRILPAFRRHGFGSDYLRVLLSEVKALGARRIQSVVLASNVEGVRFAQSRGFVEFNRYLIDGHVIPFVDLVLVE